MVIFAPLLTTTQIPCVTKKGMPPAGDTWECINN